MKAKFKPVVIASLAAGLTACAGTVETTTPHLDQQFGQAVNQALAQQTINPDASRNPDPVAGIDGQAGQAVIDRYHEGMKQEAAPATVINIGGALGGN
jgi:type IV pilus biogenesis protein CpaD/CtpE